MAGEDKNVVGGWVGLASARGSVIQNLSRTGFDLDIVSRAFPNLTKFTPCGWPSLDRPSGWTSDGHQHGVITSHEMIMNYILLIPIKVPGGEIQRENR
jgi:hypothetical protein